MIGLYQQEIMFITFDRTRQRKLLKMDNGNAPLNLFIEFEKMYSHSRKDKFHFLQKYIKIFFQRFIFKFIG